MAAHNELGRLGESLAAALYRRRGFSVGFNYRCTAGEIDVIARRPGLVVFCEVKVRSGTGFGSPAEHVRPRQIARVRAAAAHWLTHHKGGGRARFDVVSVIVRDGRPVVEHIEDAF